MSDEILKIYEVQIKPDDLSGREWKEGFLKKEQFPYALMRELKGDMLTLNRMIYITVYHLGTVNMGADGECERSVAFFRTSGINNWNVYVTFDFKDRRPFTSFSNLHPSECRALLTRKIFDLLTENNNSEDELEDTMSDADPVETT